MSTGADVLKLIEEKGIKYVDLRFTDTKGKEQHVTVPTRMVDDAFFEDGKGFDGSSIAGWKGIQESDMILMPDPGTAIVDPFFEEPTLNLRCDIVEPSTMQGYERDPRSLAKRAEAYLKSTGIADASIWGPENEFFIFDNVRHGSSMNGCFYEVDSAQGAWNSGAQLEGGNLGHRPTIKGGYFPVPPVDTYQDLRTAMCGAMEQLGLKVEVHHAEVATGAVDDELRRVPRALVDLGDREARSGPHQARLRIELGPDFLDLPFDDPGAGIGELLERERGERGRLRARRGDGDSERQRQPQASTGEVPSGHCGSFTRLIVAARDPRERECIQVTRCRSTNGGASFRQRVNGGRSLVTRRSTRRR